MNLLWGGRIERHLCPFAISSLLVHGERALKLLGLPLPPIPKALSFRPPSSIHFPKLSFLLFWELRDGGGERWIE